MRGKDGNDLTDTKIIGITPAHAGKSRPMTALLWGGSDHPRPCGEKYMHKPDSTVIAGSPPPMRGKVFIFEKCRFYSGITPAHAGKRAEIIWRVMATQDHPRPCGEKQNFLRKSVREVGSPPPMRGKVPRSIWPGIFCRITPAHAGKRPDGCICARVCRDHPRPCGEKVLCHLL